MTVRPHFGPCPADESIDPCRACGARLSGSDACGAVDKPTALSALVDALDDNTRRIAAYEDLIAELWNDIDGYYAARYYDDALLNEALAHALARGPA